MAARTAWKICSQQGWWSASGKKRGRNGKKAGPPVHNDPVPRNFTATDPNRLWLADITKHVKASSTSARSWTCNSIGSWATPSTHA